MYECACFIVLSILSCIYLRSSWLCIQVYLVGAKYNIVNNIFSLFFSIICPVYRVLYKLNALMFLISFCIIYVKILTALNTESVSGFGHYTKTILHIVLHSLLQTLDWTQCMGKSRHRHHHLIASDITAPAA